MMIVMMMIIEVGSRNSDDNTKAFNTAHLKYASVSLSENIIIL